MSAGVRQTLAYPHVSCTHRAAMQKDLSYYQRRIAGCRTEGSEEHTEKMWGDVRQLESAEEQGFIPIDKGRPTFTLSICARIVLISDSIRVSTSLIFTSRAESSSRILPFSRFRSSLTPACVRVISGGRESAVRGVSSIRDAQ